jgi:hypothetical protein
MKPRFKKHPVQELRWVTQPSHVSREERKIALELFELLKRNCPDNQQMQEVETVLSSWNDTMSTDDVLEALHSINVSGSYFADTFTQVRDERARKKRH